MTEHLAELLMYVAPEPIREANERWLTQCSSDWVPPAATPKAFR